MRKTCSWWWTSCWAGTYGITYSRTSVSRKTLWSSSSVSWPWPWTTCRASASFTGQSSPRGQPWTECTGENSVPAAFNRSLLNMTFNPHLILTSIPWGRFLALFWRLKNKTTKHIVPKARTNEYWCYLLTKLRRRGERWHTGTYLIINELIEIVIKKFIGRKVSGESIWVLTTRQQWNYLFHSLGTFVLNKDKYSRALNKRGRV